MYDYIELEICSNCIYMSPNSCLRSNTSRSRKIKHNNSECNILTTRTKKRFLFPQGGTGALEGAEIDGFVKDMMEIIRVIISIFPLNGNKFEEYFTN